MKHKGGWTGIYKGVILLIYVTKEGLKADSQVRGKELQDIYDYMVDCNIESVVVNVKIEYDTILTIDKLKELLHIHE